MSARKTVKVTDVLRWGNTYLAAPDVSFDERRGCSALLEAVLHDTRNYKGFRYLPSELTGNGVLREGYDDYRRCYHGGVS